MNTHQRSTGRFAAIATLFACASVAGNGQSFEWTTVVNNSDVVPATTNHFHAYNQPAVNNAGLVVFRARGKPAAPAEGATTEEMMIDGIFTRDIASAGPITTLARRGSAVPQPNNASYNGAPAGFQEFPSTPRIDASSSFVATRGQSKPVYSYLAADGVTQARIGTSGVYAHSGSGLRSAATLLGSVMEVQADTSYSLTFRHFSVPDGAPGTRFEQFPGSPSAADGSKVAFKGNWTDALDGRGKTGVYYRDVFADAGKAPVTLIAGSGTRIPNQPPGGNIRFGATATPSAANGTIAFTGWDNEEAPTMGGIYRAAIAPAPPLQTVVGIGDPVPGEAPGAFFRNFDEGLSLGTDGRYIAFWGSWGSETNPKLLICPDEGNKQRLAYCMNVYPNGYSVGIPVHQGIFVADTNTGQIFPVAKTGREGITDFVFWVYSGAPPGVGGSEDGSDESRELPRWRSSAFPALASNPGRLYGFRDDPSAFQVAFKAARNGVDGIYLRRGDATAALETVIETQRTAGQSVDAAAPAGSIVTAVGIERDGFRHENLVVQAHMTFESGNASVSWGGIYLAKVPALGAAITPTIALGSSVSPSSFGQSVTYSVSVSGASGTPTGLVTFLDNGTPIGGCSGLLLSSGQASCTTSSLSTGAHSIIASYSGDSRYFSGKSNSVAQAVNAPPSITTMSSRIHVGTGEDVLIGGFVIGGSKNKTVVVRGTGASLAGLGIPNALADPRLRLVRMTDMVEIAANDDWGKAQNAADLVASGFAPSHPKEAAILINLSPGAYTALVSGADGGSGVGMFEVLEVDNPDVPFESVSARARVVDGDGAMIAGFIIPPNSAHRVIIRARGPSLMALNIAQPLANPKLTLVRLSDRAIIASNDDWQSEQNAAGILASGFAPENAFESAIMTTLGPGAYTAVVQSAGNGSGVGIVEVLRLP